VVLGSGNTLRGFGIGTSAGTALAGSDFGTLTFGADAGINVTGGTPLSLVNGTLNATLATIGSGTDMVLSGLSGTLVIQGGTLSNSSGIGLAVSGGAGAITYAGSITSTGTGRPVSVAGRTGGALTVSGALSSDALGVLLENNSSSTLTFSGAKTLNTGANPALTLTNNAGSTTDLATGALTITTTSGTGIAGSSFGTLSVAGATVTSSAAPALNLAAGTVSGSFANVSAAGSSSHGVVLDGVGGTWTVSAGTVTGSAGGAALRLAGNQGGGTLSWAAALAQGNAQPVLSVAGHSNGTLNITGTLASSDASTGLVFSDANGTYGVSPSAATTLSGSGGAIAITSGSSGTFTFSANVNAAYGSGTTVPFLVNGAGPTLTLNGNLTKSGTATGLLVSIANQSGGTITFQNGTLSATVGNGIALGNADGAVNFSGTTTLSGGARAQIHSGSSGAIAFGTGASITNPVSPALEVSNGGNAANVTWAGTISTNNGRPVHVEGVSGGSVTVSGAVTATGQGLLVQNNSGGTIAFSGATKSFNTGTNAAVTLANNNGAAVNFTGGGLAITTTSGAGFAATGGGTVTVNGTTNTIATATATALRVENTGMGAGGLTFRSIDAGLPGSGPVNGIVLNSTGSAGGLTVTGVVNAAASGGTIQRASGDGIRLVSTAKVSLTRMRVHNNNGNGIYGDELTDFTLSLSEITGNDADHPTGTNEAGLFFNRLYGVNTVRSTTVEGTKGDEIRWEANGGVQGSLRVVSSKLGPNPAGEGGNGLAVVAINDAQVTAVLDSTVVTGVRSSGFLTAFANTARSTVTVSNSTFNGNNMGIDHGIGGGNGSFTFTGNTLLNHRSNAFNIISDALSTGSTRANGLISNNTVGNGTGLTGSELGNGIAVDIRGGANVAVSVTSNNVRNTNLRPYIFDSRLGSGRTDLIITNNSGGPPVDDFSSIEGIYITSRDERTTCLHMTGSQVTGLNIADYRLRQANAAVFHVQGLNVTGTNAASVAGFVQNLQTSGTAAVQTGGAGTTVNYTAQNCLTSAF
jgi:hypothetical protein